MSAAEKTKVTLSVADTVVPPLAPEAGSVPSSEVLGGVESTVKVRVAAKSSPLALTCRGRGWRVEGGGWRVEG
jgi:hypothetical protein